MAKEFSIKVTALIDKTKSFNAISKDLQEIGNKYSKKGSKHTKTGADRETKAQRQTHRKREDEKLKIQKKQIAFSNKVDKYRLSETRKLIKRGMTFEKAREMALKRSVLDEKDRRKFQWQELKEDAKDKNFRRNFFDRIKDSIFKGSFLGSGIGNMIGNVAGKFSSGVISFMVKAMSKTAEDDKRKRYLAFTLDPDEIKQIRNKISSGYGYASKEAQDDFIETVSGFKFSINQSGIHDPKLFSKLWGYVDQLVQMGSVKDHRQAFDMINSAFYEGNFKGLHQQFGGMAEFKRRFGDAFDENNKDAMFLKHNDPEQREVTLRSIMNIITDRARYIDSKNLGRDRDLMGIKDDITATIETIEESISNMTSALLPTLSDMVDWVTMFIRDPIGTLGVLMSVLGSKIMMYWELAKYHVMEMMREAGYYIREAIPGFRTGKPYVKSPKPDAIEKHMQDARDKKASFKDKVDREADEAKAKARAGGVSDLKKCRECRKNFRGNTLEKCRHIPNC